MTPGTRINIIVAVSDDWAIGRQGDMPWHISADLRFFKAKTMGSSLVMGRRPWESIGSRPLPGRENIVVSARLAGQWSRQAFQGDGPDAPALPAAVAVSSLDEAIETASNSEIFIMGGGLIYRQAIDIADRLYVTHIHTLVPDADTFFPVISPEVWQTAERSGLAEDPRSGLKYEFVTYLRKDSDEQDR